jgi:transcriptional regulator with XRE-family HTH domain
VPEPLTTDELRARVAERIRDAAKRRGIPIVVMADQAGVSRSTIWAVLAGRTPATTDTLAKLAAVLGVDPDVLVRRSPRRP